MNNNSKATLNARTEEEDHIIIIGKNFTIKGDVSGRGNAVISGHIDGNIVADRVIISAGAEVLGNIQCELLEVSGHIQGQIESREVIIRNGSLIEGDLKYFTLSVEAGGAILGSLNQFSPENSNAPISTTPKSTPVSTLSQIKLPPELQQKLKVADAGTSLHLTLASGEPAPPWVSLSPDRHSLNVDVVQLNNLKISNEKLGLRIHSGAQYFDFTLPL